MMTADPCGIPPRPFLSPEILEAMRTTKLAAGRLAAAAAALRYDLGRAADSFAWLDRFLYDTAVPAYLKEHRRLPGSERTKRLRKKRRDRVLEWWDSGAAK